MKIVITILIILSISLYSNGKEKPESKDEVIEFISHHIDEKWFYDFDLDYENMKYIIVDLNNDNIDDYIVDNGSYSICVVESNGSSEKYESNIITHYFDLVARLVSHFNNGDDYFIIVDRYSKIFEGEVSEEDYLFQDTLIYKAGGFVERNDNKIEKEMIFGSLSIYNWNSQIQISITISKDQKCTIQYNNTNFKSEIKYFNEWVYLSKEDFKKIYDTFIAIQYDKKNNSIDYYDTMYCSDFLQIKLKTKKECYVKYNCNFPDLFSVQLLYSQMNKILEREFELKYILP